MRKPTVGVYPLMPFVTGGLAATDYDDQIIKMLFDETSSFSLRRYWREISNGTLDLEATVHTIIMLEGQSWIDTLTAPGGRTAASIRACQFLRELGHAPHAFDTLVFIICGRDVDCGSTSVTLGGRSRAVCYLNDRGTQTFMAHELGHLLGLDHPFDTNTPTMTYPSGEYSDPTCIMSAEAFGVGPKPVFAVPNAQRAVLRATNAFWKSAGPGVSLATLWRYETNFPALQPYTTQVQPGTTAIPIRINRAGSSGTQLAILPATGANSWYTVEYRPSVFWDRGMPDNLAGVVIHQIRRAIGTAADGPGWPKLERVNFAGAIPALSTGDNDWSDASIYVRVVDAAPGHVDLLVGSLPATDRYVRVIGADSEVTDGRLENTGMTVTLSRTGGDCSQHQYDVVRVLSGLTVTAKAEVAGFDRPSIQFVINGTPVTAWRSLDGTTWTGNASIPITVAVPTTLDISDTRSATITVTYALERNGVTVTIPVGAGGGAFDLVVSWNCDDAPSLPQVVASPTVTLSVVTAQLALPIEAVQDQVTCLQATIAVIPGVGSRPPGGIGSGTRIDWKRVLEEMEEWKRLHVEEVGIDVLDAVQFKRDAPALGTERLAQLATTLQTTPTILELAVSAFETGLPG